MEIAHTVPLPVLPCSRRCGHLVVRKSPIGRKPVCNECQRESARLNLRKYRAENAERLYDYRQNWLKANRPRVFANEKARTEAEKKIGLNRDAIRRRKGIGSKSKEYSRDENRKRKYGITRLEYEQMLANQNGACAICDSPPTHKELRVDHNHSTGKIRGLLCDNCNVGLGRFKDSLDNLKKAAEYLKRNDGDVS